MLIDLEGEVTCARRQRPGTLEPRDLGQILSLMGLSACICEMEGKGPGDISEVPSSAGM